MSKYRLHIIGDEQKKNYSKSDMYDVMKAMEAYGGIILPNQYVEEQFEPWWDTMYIDFQIADYIVTLHWEHYTGMYLLSETADNAELQRVWESVQPLVK